MHNIEKSAFRRGEYVGYGAGLVWRIVRTNSSFGNWQARPLEHTCGDNLQLKNTSIFARRLRDMSEKLESFAAE
jgi:hypothetical protein